MEVTAFTIGGMNPVDLVIIIIIGVSVLLGLYRGFISGLLSLAALVGSAFFSLAASPQLASWLRGNEELVQTLLYYTDAGSRIRDVDLSMLTASQARSGALMQILERTNLPEAFRAVFIENVTNAQGTATVSELLSQTIVSVALSILSFLICFFVSYIVLSFVVRMICYVFELPVLRHLDALMGGAFGFARGALLVMVLMTMVPIVMAVAPVEQLTTLLEGSKLAGYFDTQLILAILGKYV